MAEDFKALLPSQEEGDDDDDEVKTVLVFLLQLF